MLPTLGIMVAVVGGIVGLYVLVRCAQVFESGAGGGTKVLAFLAAAGSILGMILLVVLAIGLVTAGVSTAAELEGLGF